ncbi:MAG: hypothetical protein RL754_1339 [Bacteroidota bacterium]
MFLFVASATMILSACTTDERRFENEVAEIEAYIATTGLDFQTDGNGVFYHIEKEGNINRVPDSNNTVTFLHVGYLLDSTIFSNGWDNSLSITADYLVPGFQEGLKILKEGGRGIVIFPSELGYGKDGATTVPSYSPLAFKIDFLSYY